MKTRYKKHIKTITRKSRNISARIRNPHQKLPAIPCRKEMLLNYEPFFLPRNSNKNTLSDSAFAIYLNKTLSFRKDISARIMGFYCQIYCEISRNFTRIKH